MQQKQPNNFEQDLINLSQIQQALRSQQNDNDYELIQRDSNTSLKFKFSLMNKQIHRLDQHQPLESIKNSPIVCSFADMQFKLSPVIHKQWLRLMSDPKLILGYMLVQPEVSGLILSRLRLNVYKQIKQEWLLTGSFMLGLYYSVVKQFVGENQNVLIFTPTYYRFLYTLNDQKKNVIEYELRTRQTENGKEFFIDFDELEKVFEENQIKLVVWANPHNPSGRVWQYEELEKLAKLVTKHKSLIFSDDIFCECLVDPSKYTSLLKFSQIHPYLIWASSFGKAFNCSGNSFSYCLVPNKQLRGKMSHAIDHIPLFVDYSQAKLLQSCYTIGEEWRGKTLKYVLGNFELLKQISKQKGLKLYYYTLDSSYLAVIDFSEYNLTYPRIKELIESQNIFPTYFDSCYVNRSTENIQIVRINLAMNRQLIHELAERLQRALKIC